MCYDHTRAKGFLGKAGQPQPLCLDFEQIRVADKHNGF